MIKKMLIITLLLLLLSGCGGKTVESTEGYIAPEISETFTDAAEESTAPAEEEDGTEAPVGDVVMVSLPTRMSSLDENGAERWHLEYTYDELGRQNGEWEFDSNGQLVYYAAITYTDSGREWLYTYPEGRTMTVRETWDEAGNLLLWECIENGEVESYTEYTYNEQGWMLSYTTVYVHEGTPLSGTYEYDDRGNQILALEYSGEELMGRTEREFDEQNRKIKAVYYDVLSDLAFTHEYTWEGNTETAVQFESNGQEDMTTVTTYDDEGNILREETRLADKIVRCVVYTYESFDIPVQ